MTRAARWLLPIFLLATTAHAPAYAEVTSLDIASRTPALGGRSFGTAGAYEMLTGRATIALDPADPHNATIRDLDLAPRNTKGQVEATTDVVILKPAHPNGTLLFEVLNRGRKLMPGWLDDTDGIASSRLTQAEDGGNGFLLDQGFTLVWAGWQLDPPNAAPGAPKNLGIDVPIATGPTGISREELQFDQKDGGKPGPKRVTLSYPAADPAAVTLSMRLTPDAAPTTPTGLTYSFEDPSTVIITPPADAPATALYTISYTARDPKVSGMGLAAIRDVTAFLRRDGTARNPLAADGRSTIHRAIALGISQSGRVLRDVLYFGLNQDEADRLVFEGMMPIIPGARRSFTNARFAQPGRNAGPQFDRLFPVLQFPFTYPVTEDPLSGKRDGILLRCLATNTCPKIIQADSEFEFWGSQASLVSTDPIGNPVDMPDNVRLFMFAGTPHGNVWNALATKRADCALWLNPNNGAPQHARPAGRDAALGGRGGHTARQPLSQPGARHPRAAGRRLSRHPRPGLPPPADEGRIHRPDPARPGSTRRIPALRPPRRPRRQRRRRHPPPHHRRPPRHLYRLEPGGRRRGRARPLHPDGRRSPAPGPRDRG